MRRPGGAGPEGDLRGRWRSADPLHPASGLASRAGQPDRQCAALRYAGSAEVGLQREPRGLGFIITIEDRGPGIPVDKLESVFEPFYRVEASRNRHTGGMGLGLYIARDLTQRMGGTLVLRPREGGGLRAELRLS
ncbi:sensor histidine kinase [Pelomonas sp. SE-A7]|uniref:sensor histidine kinase n=1 Tax=Pelomonas sp. SE-A7 TaxID=3054953 RepID=UPI00338DB681